jgi:phage/plasmid primase-like uncharacterized protein
VQAQVTDARQIAALVTMPRLLTALGFEANERRRRGPCPVHGGRNSSAFSWHEDGRWHCFSCGAGGDRIALVRVVRRCSFREAVQFLAALTGTEFRSLRVSRREIAQTRQRRERAEHAAWRIADEIGLLRRYYTDAMHRAERLQERIGNEVLRSSTEAAHEAAWERLARLIAVRTFFFAAWNFVWDAKPDTLTRFALASSTKRRQFVLGGVSR